MTIFLSIASLLLLAVNVKWMLSRKELAEKEAERLEAAMADFILAVEQENNELYDKLLERLEQTEARLEKLSVSSEAQEMPKAEAEQKPPVAEGSRRDKIRQLNKQGFSTAHIAKLLGLTMGEAEVAVQIEKKRQIQ